MNWSIKKYKRIKLHLNLRLKYELILTMILTIELKDFKIKVSTHDLNMFNMVSYLKNRKN